MLFNIEENMTFELVQNLEWMRQWTDKQGKEEKETLVI